MEETHIAALKQYLPALEMPEDIDDDMKKFLTNQAKNYTLLNNVLFRLNQETYQHRKVLNKEEAIHAVYMEHQHPLGGHLAYNNTLNKLSIRYYWPNMTKDVMTYVKECTRCQAFAPKSLNERLHPIVVKTVPFEQIEIDVNHLPISSDGSRYVIGAICMLTKYVELKPIKYQTTAEIAIFIYERIICVHGTPSIIITDNGRPMVSELVQQVCRQYNIIHKTGSAYNSQSQGLIERLNRTLNQVLRRRTTEEKENWHAYLPAAQFSYNTLKQAATKYSPFYLLYGYHPKTPFDVVHSLPSTEVDLDRLIERRIARQIHTLATVRMLAIKRIELSQKMQRERIDKKLLSTKKELKPRFKLGDLVEVFNHFTHTSWSGKLLDRWTGLYTVVRVLKKGSYEIQGHKRNGDIVRKIVHGNKLQKYVIPNVAWHPANLYKNTQIEAGMNEPLSSTEENSMPEQEENNVYPDFPIVGSAKRKRLNHNAPSSEKSVSEISFDDGRPKENSSDSDLFAMLYQVQDSPLVEQRDDLEFELRQAYKLYKLLQEELAICNIRNEVMVKQVGDLILKIVHLRSKKPSNPVEVFHYKDKRAEFMRTSLWADNPEEARRINAIKTYVKKHDPFA